MPKDQNGVFHPGKGKPSGVRCSGNIYEFSQGGNAGRSIVAAVSGNDLRV